MSLNEKQREVVNYTEGPVVVIAGPGTGKTKTLVERIVNILINKKVEANKIIFTTFTNKAARELEIRINERLHELGQNIDISEIYLGTMHSIWFRLIHENINYSNFFDNFKIINGNHEQHFFIYSRMKEYKGIDNYEKFFKNVSNIDYNTDWAKAGFIRDKINYINENNIDIENIHTDDDYIKFIKEAYNIYQKQLFETNSLDFSYLQVEFLNMLLNNSEFLKKINDKFEYIMVDEYQDSNKIQEKILFTISKDKKNICVVGDEDQSIYRFRGANAENILNFSKKFKNNECKVIILDINYRSLYDIVEFNNSWIKSINWYGNRYDKNILAARNENLTLPSVYNISGTNMEENIKNTVTFIKKLKATNKITNYNQIAILFSNFKGILTANKLEEKLKLEGIDVYSPRTKKFFEMYEIKLTLGTILACFKKVFLPDEDRRYLHECLNIARVEIKKDKEFTSWIKEKISNIHEYNFDSFNNIFYELLQFSFYRNILNETGKKTIASNNLSILSKIFNKFQKYVFYKKVNEKKFLPVRYFFNTYINILMRSNLEELFLEEDYPDNCIPFLTIHQSKGLEFPVVIVFTLSSKPKTSFSQKESSIDRLFNANRKISELEQEYFDFYRKFYVAFTRAKNLLVLSSYQSGVSENFKPFFNNIPGINSKHFNIEKIKLDELIKKEDRKVLSYTTDILPYRYCSMKYNLVREKKYSTYSKRELTFGIIVHKVIEHLNKISLQNNVYISDDYLKNLVENVYKFQNIALDENIEKIVNLSKWYLEEEKENLKYIKNVEASEYRIEDNFILYGEIDLILEKENHIEIIDFKTGKYLEDDIYFENYRQQLSLYKLLLEKKYSKEIKTKLYYLEEKLKKEIVITSEDLKRDYISINETVENILNKNFNKISYDEKICGDCEFKYYCWGEK